MGKKNLTYKLRKNPYIVSTFVLGLFCLVIIVGNIIEAKSIDGTENEILCSVISGTPAWSSNGKLIRYGVIIPQNISIDLVNEILIPERIKMFYNPHCSACERQINDFKEQGTWEKYKQEGLAISCN